jgi:hypothetical protein
MKASNLMWTVLIVTLLCMNVIQVPIINAADEIACRNVLHSQKAEMIEVGDVPGHFMGVSQAAGLAFYTKGPDAGTIATREGVTTFDIINGKGTYSGHEVKTFPDGAKLFVKYSGTQTPADGGKKTIYEGKWEVTGGTARFAGVKGSGTLKGERIGPPKTGGDTYTDIIGTLSK